MAITYWDTYRAFIARVFDDIINNNSHNRFKETTLGTNLMKLPLSKFNGAYSIEFVGVEKVDMQTGSSQIWYDTIIKLNLGFIVNQVERIGGMTGSLSNAKTEYNNAANDILYIIQRLLIEDRGGNEAFESIEFRGTSGLEQQDAQQNFFLCSLEFMFRLRVVPS